jgi:Sulfotransferase family
MQFYSLELTAPELMKRSREITGISKVDDDIQPALERLVHSLNTEAQLSQEGARHIQVRILNILNNRLRMQRDYDAHPEIDDQQIVQPHILTGAGRSGSTKMHKVLAASGDFKYLRFWHQYNPAVLSGRRAEDPSARVLGAHHFTQWFDERVPLARQIHSYETFEPEEETFLFDHLRFLINFNITHTTAPSYMQWVMGQDMVAQLSDLKQWIKYLQWQFFDEDDRPWVLKNPLYSGLEPLLAQVFPGAVMVATHRDPAARVASSAGLTFNFKKAYSDVDRTEEVGPGMVELMANFANQYVAGRDAYPDVKILDIGYRELTRDSEDVVRKIYHFAGRPLPEKILANVAAWEEKNRQHKHGVYKYSLEQYGITKEVILDKFKVYNERFADYL